jgi:hypothetical protein
MQVAAAFELNQPAQDEAARQLPKVALHAPPRRSPKRLSALNGRIRNLITQLSDSPFGGPHHSAGDVAGHIFGACHREAPET